MYALNVDKADASMLLVAPVLPRRYRHYLGVMFQFIPENSRVPRHLGSFAVFLFFFLSLLHGVLSSGRIEGIMKVVMSNIGFVVTDVGIVGNKRITEQDVLRVLGLDSCPSIISFEVDKARSILEHQVWVKSAGVRKIYPNRVRIAIVEREPYAVWQHDGMMDIIDDTGRVILPFQAGLAQGLPLVVGQGAQSAAKLVIQALSAYPQLHDRVRTYVRVGDRRWDIFLNNGMRIMLPEKDAIKRISFLFERGIAQDLFSRDVLSVDLRLSDRITVALPNETLARYHAAVAEEEKALEALKVGGM